MKTSKIFDVADAEIEQMIAAYPLANLVSGAGASMQASALPLLLHQESNGEHVFIGHFARANPQVAQLQADPCAMLIFQGEQAYISPSWFDDRTQAPTWNFATVHYWVEIQFLSDDESRFAVDLLTERMEKGRVNPWQSSEMDARLERMLPAIIGFRAKILRRSVKFKLGQNERLQELQQSLLGLRAEGHLKMVDAMLAANRSRFLDQVQTTAV